MSKEKLVQVYVAALNLSSVDGIPDILFAKPAHAEMAEDCCRDANEGAVSRDGLINAAALVGAPWQTAGQVRTLAEAEVEKLLADIDRKQRAGELRQVNRDYKAYRMARASRGEHAIPYNAYFSNFVASVVRLAAEKFSLQVGESVAE